MLSPFIQIAITKARSTAEREMLDGILSLAAHLDEIEATFEARINASKAARGEDPTKLSKSRRGELQQLAADEKELAAEQLALFRELNDPAEIVAALRAGMEADVKFWSQAHRHTHAGDLPVVRELVEAKTKVFESMARFLAAKQ